MKTRKKQILIEKYIEPSETKIGFNGDFSEYWFDRNYYLHSFMGQPAVIETKVISSGDRRIETKSGKVKITIKDWFKKGECFKREGFINYIENGSEITKLFLYENCLSNIDVLESLTNLIELNLFYNSIKNINALKNLTNLKILSLLCNQITNIDALKNLTNLTYLCLENNPVKAEQIEELQKSLPNCEIHF